MSFAEVRIPLGVNYGVVGGPNWSTTAIVTGDGKEQRISNWSEPLHTYSFSRGDRNPLNEAEKNQILNFFNQRRGREIGFRYRDWADWQTGRQALGVSNGSMTVFQLLKLYNWGNSYWFRPIEKPVIGSVRVWLDDSELFANWQLDPTDGRIIFGSPVAAGVQVWASCDFDIPVRLKNDRLETRYLARGAYELSTVELEEYRIGSAQVVPLIPPPVYVGESLFLGHDVETIGGPGYSTQINETGSGFELRTSNYPNPRHRYQVNSRRLNRTELNRLINIFSACRGAATSFLYYDRQTATWRRVRFESDSLRFRFVAMAGNQAFFDHQGFNLVECL
jgi:uncharacterized protein (TIGR02217 family)